MTHNPIGQIYQPDNARCSRSLLPCACGGKVGSRAAVKFHPRLNLMDGITRFDVRCDRCKKVATTKDGKGFQNWKAALRVWNHVASEVSPTVGQIYQRQINGQLIRRHILHISTRMVTFRTDHGKKRTMTHRENFNEWLKDATLAPEPTHFKTRP